MPMMTVEFTITPKLTKDFNLDPVQKAMADSAEALAAALQSALTGTVFPGMNGPVEAPEIAAKVRHNDGTLEFVVTRPVELEKLEEGTKPWDMKPGLLNGPRHRVSKDGTRYNIIPFFHDKDKMPSDIASLAEGLSPSYVVGQYIDELGVKRNTYEWGGQLPSMPNTSLLSLSVSPTGYARKNNKYGGMVNMHGTGYMTFRTVSDKSPPESWWNPGKPGNQISESVWKFMEPAIEACIQQAWGEVFSAW